MSHIAEGADHGAWKSIGELLGLYHKQMYFTREAARAVCRVYQQRRSKNINLFQLRCKQRLHS